MDSNAETVRDNTGTADDPQARPLPAAAPQVGARVALATDASGIAHDGELPLLVAALRARGVDATTASWDDAGFDWAAQDLVIIRSTWEYTGRLPEFLAWADRVDAVTSLHSPARVVRWNSDKRYLAELAALAVPTVPTRFIAPGEDIALPEHGDIVVKPSVSAGARNSARYTPTQRDAAEAHVRLLQAAGETAMVQPYMDRIADGERALVYLGGRFSHALRKGPVLTDTGRIDNERTPHPDLTAHVPDEAERDLAAAALAAAATAVGAVGVYARVDLVRGADGAPVVMELELIEPNLFLTASPGGVDRFVDAVARLVADNP
ncbi:MULTISPECIES: RimK family alpha-L-glutamate ligase [unclassified Streptomyces]|uniref:ATP-grasp domain-containing protein n=1 Tax=unclassified Streptomyces TaxID=2593676 RepID=UPI00364D08FB